MESKQAKNNNNSKYVYVPSQWKANNNTLGYNITKSIMSNSQLAGKQYECGKFTKNIENLFIVKQHVST